MVFFCFYFLYKEVKFFYLLIEQRGCFLFFWKEIEGTLMRPNWKVSQKAEKGIQMEALLL